MPNPTNATASAATVPGGGLSPHPHHQAVTAASGGVVALSSTQQQQQHPLISGNGPSTTGSIFDGLGNIGGNAQSAAVEVS